MDKHRGSMAWCADTGRGVHCVGTVAVAIDELVVVCTSLGPWLNA